MYVATNLTDRGSFELLDCLAVSLFSSHTPFLFLYNIPLSQLLPLTTIEDDEEIGGLIKMVSAPGTSNRLLQ